MEKMAVLKYGNEKENCILYDYRKLGAGIVTFDLLRTKHTNVIPLKQLIAQSCTAKGAAFILYNVARLQSILNTFNEHVTSGYYEKLPKLDRIDFTLLREEVHKKNVCLLFVIIDGTNQKSTKISYFFPIYFCRKNGKYCMFILLVFQMYWSVVLHISNLVKLPSICFAPI